MSENPEFEKALKRAANLCARAEHSSLEISRKLAGWGISADDASRIVAWLVEHRYIDDRRFARAFVIDRFTQNRWGRIRIMNELRMRGIGSKMAREVMDEEIDEDQYAAMAQKLVEARRRMLPDPDSYQSKAKIVRYMASRGFEPGLVSDIVF